MKFQLWNCWFSISISRSQLIESIRSTADLVLTSLYFPSSNICWLRNYWKKLPAVAKEKAGWRDHVFPNFLASIIAKRKLGSEPSGPSLRFLRNAGTVIDEIECSGPPQNRRRHQRLISYGYEPLLPNKRLEAYSFPANCAEAFIGKFTTEEIRSGVFSGAQESYSRITVMKSLSSVTVISSPRPWSLYWEIQWL